MIGNLEPEERVMSTGGMLGQFAIALDTLGWDKDDEISVEIAGSQVYGIPGAGTKWAPVEGTKRYNNDAFIVVKNKSRNPVIPSQLNPELEQHHGSHNH